MKCCILCNAEFETSSQLAVHRRAEHRRYRGPNRRACEKLLRSLRDDGHLSDETVALEQALRSMADQLDFDPSNAQMWRYYRELQRDLVGDGGGDEEDVIERLRRGAEVASGADLRDPA